MTKQENTMHSVIGFCPFSDAKGRKGSALNISQNFQQVIKEFWKTMTEKMPEHEFTQMIRANQQLKVEVDYITGKMNVADRSEKLDKLRLANKRHKTTQILFNARCLSEGIDVPALDAVIFMHPRKRKIDIIQAIGRVMRRAPKKKFGYIIIPVVIPLDKTADQAFKNSKYEVIWQVLNALRSHDDRVASNINAMELGANIANMTIEVMDLSPSSSQNERQERNPAWDQEQEIKKEVKNQFHLLYDDTDFIRDVKTLINIRCGDRSYWKARISDLARAMQDCHQNLKTYFATDHQKVKKLINNFVSSLQNEINDTIDEASVTEMLAQHMISIPIFEALLPDAGKRNAVAKTMQTFLDSLPNKEELDHRLAKFELKQIYSEIKKDFSCLPKIEAKQKFIKDIYEGLFKKVFPKIVKKYGIVYTPIAVVDFMLHSVNDLLQEEFETTLSKPNVNILDPFIGTGTFITRLLSNQQLIDDHDLVNKYAHEIHGIEINLLAYYLSNLNIEQVYYERTGEYKSFSKLVLTDSFNLNEETKDNWNLEFFEENNERIKNLKRTPIKVIIGNPPYSKGQASVDDNNKNTNYPVLSKRIKETFLRPDLKSKSNVNSIYDSYIFAILWASDRIKEQGMIAFITNNGWLKNKSAIGMRRYLEKEFDKIYIFDLRGNIQVSMKDPSIKKEEGGNIFKIRSGVAIVILIRNNNKNIPIIKEKVFYVSISQYGNNLNQSQKIECIKNLQSISKIKQSNFKIIETDKYGDWLDQIKNNNFFEFISVGNKKEKKETTNAIFINFTCGVQTSRTSWCVNSDKKMLNQNMRETIDFYNQSLESQLCFKKNEKDLRQKKEIKWSDCLEKHYKNKVKVKFDPLAKKIIMFKLFSKKFLYYQKFWNECIFKNNHIFPLATKLPNECIFGSEQGYFISDTILDYYTLGVNQCFPKYLYLKIKMNNLFNQKDIYINKTHTRKSGISDFSYKYFQYEKSPIITKNEIFYYVYGIVSHIKYLKKYKKHIKKQGIPHVPRPISYNIFKKFSDAGKKLSQLHLNYEKLPVYTEGMKFVFDEEKYETVWKLPPKCYQINKPMKFGKTANDKRKTNDRSTIIVNDYITIKNVPEEVYQYKIGYWSAVEHVMRNNKLKIDKATEIIDDPNKFSDDPQYLFKLLFRVMKMAVESSTIINDLPQLPDTFIKI